MHRRIPVVTPDQIHAPPPDAPTVAQIAFRSSYVRLDRLQAEHLALYTCAPRVSTQLTEAELDAQLAVVGAELGLEQLIAEIRDGGVHVRGRAAGATADAFVRVAPDLSERLDDVVQATVEYVEVRVPRSATSVTVTEAELAERVGEALRGAFARLDDTILHALGPGDRRRRRRHRDRARDRRADERHRPAPRLPRRARPALDRGQAGDRPARRPADAARARGRDGRDARALRGGWRRPL